MRIVHLLCVLTLALLPALGGCGAVRKTHRADVVVYGGTPGGITAAIAAAREGRSVILLEPTRHVGGLSTSGLNRDESEHMHRDQTFGGLADAFFFEAANRSGANVNRKAKVWQSRFAEEVFLEMLGQAGVTIHFGQRVARVERAGLSIRALTTKSGEVYLGRVFIDASYEGDLMALAGVSYVTGRESREQFGESLAGVTYADESIPVSPFDADGQLLPGVMPDPPPTEGAASPHPTPYNIRLNLTTDPANRVAITRPSHYDPAQYELLARCIEAGLFTSVGQVIGRYGMPGGKTEINNQQLSIVSMSLPGAQTPWAEASHEERERIYLVYKQYTQGLLWFLMSDPRVPEPMRKDTARYGLCRDEWVDNDHWPWQLYVREARRMRGAYVMTQRDITEDLAKQDVIHLGSHYIDSHHVARYAVDPSSFVNEGRLWQHGMIYQFPYRAITPIQRECDNLLVPVCVSASHVAFCSIRVEASWMMLGEAAGIAAALACDRDCPVQKIDVKRLQDRLRQLGIPLEAQTSKQP